MRLSVVLAIAMTLTTVGCNINVKKEKKSESYSYDFTENGCPTGKHTFSSVSALCAGLADHDLNKGCAYYSRAQMAKSYNCPEVANNNSGGVSRPMSSPFAGIQSRSSFSYQITVNGCDTGPHQFDTKSAYCAGLMNDALNNNCAREERLSTYQDHDCDAR